MVNKNNIQRPVILFSDFHDTRNNYHLAKRLTELGIVLICLYPNSTHLLQPLDVSCFRPLKQAWRRKLNNLNNKIVNPKEREKVTIHNFATYFVPILNKAITPETIQNGFMRTGLYPWDREAVDYSKCDENVQSVNVAPFQGISVGGRREIAVQTGHSNSIALNKKTQCSGPIITREYIHHLHSDIGTREPDRICTATRYSYDDMVIKCHKYTAVRSFVGSNKFPEVFPREPRGKPLKSIGKGKSSKITKSTKVGTSTSNKEQNSSKAVASDDDSSDDNVPLSNLFHDAPPSTWGSSEDDPNLPVHDSRYDNTITYSFHQSSTPVRLVHSSTRNSPSIPSTSIETTATIHKRASTSDTSIDFQGFNNTPKGPQSPTASVTTSTTRPKALPTSTASSTNTKKPPVRTMGARKIYHDIVFQEDINKISIADDPEPSVSTISSTSASNKKTPIVKTMAARKILQEASPSNQISISALPQPREELMFSTPLILSTLNLTSRSKPKSKPKPMQVLKPNPKLEERLTKSPMYSLHSGELTIAPLRALNHSAKNKVTQSFQDALNTSSNPSTSSRPSKRT